MVNQANEPQWQRTLGPTARRLGLPFNGRVDTGSVIPLPYHTHAGKLLIGCGNMGGGSEFAR